MDIFKVKDRNPMLVEQLERVWKESVKETLSPSLLVG